ncbi:MAG: glycosyltransferase family 2 protein [Actinobacteria bacterium]|nr:glycosyltransferase family 2 protein [Actinomycetota bacterium]
MAKPSIICLTPVKNEEWILDRFLKAVSLWADHIIISDQNSEDNSVEIAKQYPKTIIIKNPYIGEYNEWEIRKIVIDEARKIQGPRILIALDADELLTPNFLNSPEWNKILNSTPGMIIKSKFVNIAPDMDHYWSGPVEVYLGFSDDSSEYVADKIHTARLIAPKDAPVLHLEEIKIMHYQFTDWERMESKHRWYQCWERINNPGKSAIRIYRPYHHMYSVRKNEMNTIPAEWVSQYSELGIDIKKVNKDKFYYWDKIVLGYIDKYGAGFFAKDAIWDINWVRIAEMYGFKDSEKFRDPRNFLHKTVHWWLKKTQRNHTNIFVRVIDKFFEKFMKI